MKDLKIDWRELMPLHRYCLHYRKMVRCGKKPSTEQDTKFIRYSTLCYEEGIAYEL